jgi:hypothetical protein
VGEVSEDFAYYDVACGRYVILGFLLWVLASKVKLLPPRMEDLRLGRFVKSGKNNFHSLTFSF